jgi:hypothetical protein
LFPAAFENPEMLNGEVAFFIFGVDIKAAFFLSPMDCLFDCSEPVYLAD